MKPAMPSFPDGIVPSGAIILKKHLIPLLLSTGLLLTAAGAYQVWQALHSSQRNAAPSTQVFLPAFRLQTAAGPLTERNLRGHWTFLFFGYTHCPDICPTAFSSLKAITQILHSAGMASPSVIFVSVDPARDTPQLLATYAHAFDSAFVGATASDTELDPLVRALGVFYQRNDTGGDPHYSIDHTANLYLIDPAGRLSKTFPPPLDAAAIGRELNAILPTLRP